MSLKSIGGKIKKAAKKVYKNNINVVGAYKGMRKAKRGAMISAQNLKNLKYNARQKSIGSSNRKPILDPKTLKSMSE